MSSILPSAHRPFMLTSNTLSHHFNSPASAIAQIDGEIAKLLEDIRALKTFRNTFLPINRFPPRVLALIISFVQDKLKKPQSSSSSYDDDVALPLWWIRFTHVSQHWRNVALASPDLWSYISTSYPKRIVDEWRKRSRNAHLHIFLRTGPRSTFGAELIANELFRIRDLTFYSSSLADLLRGLSSPAPHLRSLKVRIDKKTTSNPMSITNLLSNQISRSLCAPRLQRLELLRCSIDMDVIPISTGLTVLKLIRPTSKVFTMDFLGALRALPRLVLISLVDVIRNDSEPVATANQDLLIALPSLQSLSFTNQSFRQDLNILSHLSFPMNAAVTLVSRSRTRKAKVDLMALMNVYKTNYQQPLNLSRSLAGTMPTASPPELSFHYSSVRLILFIASWKVTIDGPFDNPNNGTNRNPGTGNILNISDTTEVGIRFLSLPFPSAIIDADFAGCKIDVKAWVKIFDSLPKIATLRITGSSAVTFVSAFVNDFRVECPAIYKRRGRRNEDGDRVVEQGGAEEGQDEAGPGGVEPRTSDEEPIQVDWDPILPELKDLRLVDGAFSDNAETEDFVNALRARKKAGYRLGFLICYRCKGVNHQAGRLSKVVEKVRVAECS